MGNHVTVAEPIAVPGLFAAVGNAVGPPLPAVGGRSVEVLPDSLTTISPLGLTVQVATSATPVPLLIPSSLNKLPV